MVLSNLRFLLGPVPDVVALEIAAAARFKTPPPVATPIPAPPFLRHALEILVKERPDLLPEGQFPESVLQNLYLDSPWTSWQPELLPKPVLRQLARLDSPKESSLDWMESAVLDAGLRGEFDFARTEAMAKQLVVTPALLRDASKRLNQSLENFSQRVLFNEDYLAEGENPVAEIRFENWAAQGAAAYNQPLPMAFKGATAHLSASKDLALRGPAADVYIKMRDGETQLGIRDWKLALQDLDRSFPDLRVLTPKSREGSATSFALSARYESNSPRGAVVLASAGPPAKPQSPQFTVLSAGTRWQGLRDSIQAFLRDFGLPRQVAKASEVSHQIFQFGSVEGSLRFKFDSEITFGVLGQAEDEGKWHSTEVPYPLSVAGASSKKKAFQFGFFRDPKGTITFAIHRAARSAYPPIYLAELEVASFQWYEWLRQASTQTRQQSEPVASTFLEMARVFASRIQDRAFYHWLDNRSHQDESWYRAESIEVQDVASAITRVLARKYIAAVRSLLEQRASETPLIEIQIEGTENLDLLEQGMDGSFDLRDQRQGVIISGALVSVVGQRQSCPLLLGTGRPTVLVDDGDRVTAVDTTYDSPEMGIARMQAAAAAGGSGPVLLSAPSAVLTSFFSGASSDLLQLILSALVQRWFPTEVKNWRSLIDSIGTQAGALQWNAILQLKLRWAIDIRKAGNDAALASELIHSTLRRELRLLLPFVLLDNSNIFANLKKAIPLLIYHLLPPDVSSVADLEMNFDLPSKLIDYLIPLRRALKQVDIATSDETWNIPYWTATASASWSLKLLLAWEEHVCQAVALQVSELRRNPKGRVTYLDRLAVEIVDALFGLPMLAGNPRAVNAIRTFIFTTALSLMASDPANVVTELSLTALDSQASRAIPWIESPESMPLSAVVAYSRLSATAQSWSPAALRARRAMTA